MKHRFAIIGALWKDKINGNTYYNTKIVDTTTGKFYFTGYHYGYDEEGCRETRPRGDSSREAI